MLLKATTTFPLIIYAEAWEYFMESYGSLKHLMHPLTKFTGWEANKVADSLFKLDNPIFQGGEIYMGLVGFVVDIDLVVSLRLGCLPSLLWFGFVRSGIVLCCFCCCFLCGFLVSSSPFLGGNKKNRVNGISFFLLLWGTGLSYMKKVDGGFIAIVKTEGSKGE